MILLVGLLKLIFWATISYILYILLIKKKWYKKIPIVVLVLITLFLIKNMIQNYTSSSQNIEDCLVGYDWCLPDCNNATNSWKFNSEYFPNKYEKEVFLKKNIGFSGGDFSYSTTLFGGMSAWGTWKDIGGNQIELIYNKTSTGDVLPKKILIMPNCNSLKVGAALYKKTQSRY